MSNHYLSMRILSLLFFLSLTSFGQSVLVPLNTDYYHLIDRYEIKSGKLSNEFHSNFKGYNRKAIVNLTKTVEPISDTDKFNLQYLQNDSWEWLPDSLLKQSDSKNPIFKKLYRKKSDFVSYQDKEFDLHLNPVFQFGYGTDNIVDNQPFVNTRGVEVRGAIGRKLGFYSYLSDNIVTYPHYVRQLIRQYNGFPNEGFTKIERTDVDSVRLKTNYFSARGYISFNPIKQIQLQFGHDRNFIGSGIRSMILSDFSAPYMQLRSITHVGKVQYVNIFAQMPNAQIQRPASGQIPMQSKYMAFHHLNWNVNKNLNLGVFETIMFSQRKIGFDINYLNPIIFYRFVEGHLGSSDNSIVGADFKYNFLKHGSIYGQFALDEFSLSNLKEGKGWWGNKYAAQIGAKYIDFMGIPNLDLQAEFNLARPYMYSHFASYSNFVNYNMPMAHPIGANFKEILIQARLQTLKRLFVTGTVCIINTGENIGSQNWGQNILWSYEFNRQRKYGNVIGQGRRTNIVMFDLNTSYMIRHNVFADFQAFSRIYDSGESILNSVNSGISFGLRMNIARRNLMF